MNICSKCTQTAVDGRYCYTHHVEAKKAQWLDNSDPDNLGIVKWARELLPEFAFNDTPWFHKVLYLSLLGLYNPEYKNKFERLLEFESFRGSAKSTAANTIFVSYLVAHNGEKSKVKIGDKIVTVTLREATIVIISETSEGAEEFTVRVRDTFSNSERLRYYYRVAIERALDDATGQWRRASFKINEIYIQARGAGQQIRGKVKGRSRPTLIIADDIYSENTIKTEKRRADIRSWWNDAVMNSIDDLQGKAVVLGTILHQDTILVDLEENPLWRLIKIPAMGHINEYNEPVMDKFDEFIGKHLEVNWTSGTCSLPYDEILDQDARFTKQRKYFKDIEEEFGADYWELAWPARVDLYYLALKFQEAVHNNTLAGMYQEYFHITKPPFEKQFKPEYFQPIPEDTVEFKIDYGITWLKVFGKWHNCDVQIGVDLAGLGKDFAVINIVAVIPDGRVFVLKTLRGKYSIRDDVKGDTSSHLRYNRVVTEIDRSKISRIGIADELVRQALIYQPTRIKIGVAAEEALVVQEIQRVFEKNNLRRVYIMERRQQGGDGNKEERIANTLLPWFETRMVYILGSFRELRYQLEFLGSAKHDDIADALECAFFSLIPPYIVNIEDYQSRDMDPSYEIDGLPSSLDMKKIWRMA